jgi:hypothetical protein
VVAVSLLTNTSLVGTILDCTQSKDLDAVVIPLP